jgi:hypothetical protein
MIHARIPQHSIFCRLVEGHTNHAGKPDRKRVRLLLSSVLVECRLLQWVRRKATDAPSVADGGPTAALHCPHGGLLPEQAAGAKRQLVPERVWAYFLHNAEQVEGAHLEGHQSFRGDVETCQQCQTEINKAASKKEGLR